MMNGKSIKLNDYKFTYGQETIYLNVYGAFKDKKSGNKYVIYSNNIDNKLHYGSLFVRNNELIVMVSKEKENTIIKDYVNSIINDRDKDKFDNISLEKIDSMQIIDDAVLDFDVDLNSLYDKTFPEIEEEVKEVVKEKKHFSIATLFFILFFIVVICFFFVNPEVITGKNINYSCTKSYNHEVLPANVNDKVNLIFNNKNTIISIKNKSEYIFNDVEFYKEFKEKGYSYKYFDGEGSENYNDEKYTYTFFSEVNTSEDYFLPTETNELLNYYKQNGYNCVLLEDE